MEVKWNRKCGIMLETNGMFERDNTGHPILAFATSV